MTPAPMPFHIGQLVTRPEKSGVCRVMGYVAEHGSLKLLLADVTDMFHPQAIIVSPWSGLKAADHLDV